MFGISKPWLDVSRHFGGGIAAMCLPAILAVFPLAGYTTLCIVISSAVALMFIAFKIYQAERGKKLHVRERRAAAFLSVVLVLASTVGLVEASAKMQKEDTERAARAEFLGQQDRKISGVVLHLQLNRPYRPQDLQHDRMALEISDLNLNSSDKNPTMWLLGADDQPFLGSKSDDVNQFDLMQAGLTEDGAQFQSLGQGYFMADWNPTHLDISIPIKGSGPFVKLRDFDRLSAFIFVTEPLSRDITCVSFSVDEYVLFQLSMSDLKTIRSEAPRFHDGKTPIFSPKEQLAWAQVIPNVETGRPSDANAAIKIDFSRYTPSTKDQLLSTGKRFTSCDSVPPIPKLIQKSDNFPF